MPTAVATNVYSRCTKLQCRLLQVMAVADESLSHSDLAKIYKAMDWPGDNSNKTTLVGEVKKQQAALIKRGVLSKENYNDASITQAAQDFAIQAAIREGVFDQICNRVQDLRPRSDRNYRFDPRRSRDLRIAFFNGDVSTYQTLSETEADVQPASLLQPFDQSIYNLLAPVMQEMYMLDMFPKLLVGEHLEQQDPDAEPAINALDALLNSDAGISKDLMATAIDVYFCAGRMDALSAIDKLSGKEFPEAAGFISLLRGDVATAEAVFASAIGLRKGTKKKSKTAQQHLCGIFCALLLLAKNTSDATQQANALLNKIAKSKPGYPSLVDILQRTAKLQRTPTSAPKFVEWVSADCAGPLDSLIAGYCWRWNLTPDEAPLGFPGLNSAATQSVNQKLTFVATELAGLIGHAESEHAAAYAKKHLQLHKEWKTHSLIELAIPVPRWQQTLAALSQFESPVSVTTTGAQPASGQRMIWELTSHVPQGSLTARPLIQKYSAKGGWTKGQAVSLERLSDQRNSSKFDFLTSQDHDICSAIMCETDRNHYGYNETIYYFHDALLARAIINHPRLFVEGERENPIEVTEVQPRLLVNRTEDEQISLSLDPEPKKFDRDSGLQLIEHGKHRLDVVFFTDRQLALHDMLGGTLTVPAHAEQTVMSSIQPLASLVSINSEVDDHAPTGETVAADSQIHLQLVPYESGLQLSFCVRPLGDDGPFFTPGEGATTVVARIGNQSLTTRRELSIERNKLSVVLADCPAIAAHVGDGEPLSEVVYLPTPETALAALLEFDTIAADDKLTMHWPRGRSFEVAGQVTGTDFRMNIKRDRDWFAASGTLKVDESLTLDLIRLIELVDASSSRFVRLSDGRFLALTEKFRRSIEELSAYSERSNDKLRFPPICAAALESADETFTLKSDKHWKNCLTRIRESDEVTAEVPSTLAAELRDYQIEGFQWLARLSHWGAGACLADDMGLGKTIEALALLVHRSSGGPALVVAPTSVAFNWQSEIQRFAPTLTAHLFGDGDRAESLSDLGPRDVVICSYGLLHSESKLLQAQSWHTVVLDEAQAIKNVATKRSEAAMGLQADFRMILTGTPMENHLGELWNLFQFINPGLLGSLSIFQERFANPIERDGCRETRRRLKKLIQPFILRRTKAQVLQELPSRTEITLQVQPSTEESAMYEALRQVALKKLSNADDDRPTHLKILAELMRLRRFCCHPRLVDPDTQLTGAKLSLFSETIDELLQGGHKVLVFSQFVDHLTVLREELDRQEVNYQYLDGSTSAKQRKQRVEAFQSGDGDVFLISLKAGGVGLNLTSADYVIHMDPWWNPAVEDQASDRAHRLGQQRPVTIYRFITEGTIEERILELHGSKRDLADSLLEGTDRSGKLSTAELLKLIQA